MLVSGTILHIHVACQNKLNIVYLKQYIVIHDTIYLKIVIKKSHLNKIYKRTSQKYCFENIRLIIYTFSHFCVPI